jgi:hypothetical protein
MESREAASAKDEAGPASLKVNRREAALLQSLDLAVVLLQPRLVLAHLPVELVDQIVQGGIQILVRTFGEHVVALHVDLALGSLSSFLFLQLFHSQQHPDIDDLFEVAGDSIKLGGHVIPKCGGDFEVVTADRQVHGKASCCFN